MQEKNNLISVIVPVYNCERYLPQAIETILDQTYEPIEIIVINDGSTDRSEEIAKRFLPRIRYYSHPNKGPGATRNKGAKLANGQFLAFLDSDDLWLPNKLERQMGLFSDHPDLDMVFGYVKQFHSPELAAELKNKTTFASEIMKGFLVGTLLINRKSFFRTGLFETNWKVGEFIDWYLKAMERGLKSHMLPEIVMKRRIHADNMGIRERKHQTDYIRILKASLDRHRGNRVNKAENNMTPNM